jgi:hypothetical protein
VWLTILTPRFSRRRIALVTSKEVARALARCIVALVREPLPGPGDCGGRLRVIALITEPEVVAAILTSGWGDNRYGQLGDGTLETREVPVDVVDLELD